MPKRLLAGVTALVTGALALGAGRPAGAAARLRVVATVGDLGAIAREVLGDAGEVTVLARPTQDPHFVDARPNLIVELNRAEALVSMGLDYELGWLPLLVRGSKNPLIQPGAAGSLVASTLVPLLDRPRPKGAATAPDDRAAGDLHGGANPHLTLDPRNGVRLAQAMAAAFGALHPDRRALYRHNADLFAAELAARQKSWEAALGPYRGTPIVTYHRSFVYLTAWLGLVEVGTIEPRPGTPPSAAHLAEIIGITRARHVPVVLQERWYPSSVGERIAAQTGARLVLVPGMTPDGGRYGDHIDEVVRALTAALGASRGEVRP